MAQPPILFSVVVSTLNAAKALQQCIDLYAGQTFDGKELIVIDGGSKDGTAELLAANLGSVTRYISESDDGISDAWNKALPLITGEWVIFLGADDYFWSPTVLEEAASKLKALAESVLVAYGQVVTVTSSGEPIQTWGRAWSETEAGFRSAMNIPHQGVFHRRKLFDLMGGFDPQLRYAGDYDLLLRSILCSKPVYIGDLKISAMTVGGVSSRPSLSWKVLDEFRLARKNRGFPPFTLPWLWAISKAIVKREVSRVLGDSKATVLLEKMKHLAP